MTELYLNDNLVVLTPDVQIALTRQINDIGEIQQRQADFTNHFLIKKSSNAWLMDMLNTPGNSSRRGYKFMTARILSEGVQIITDGNAIVTETRDRDAYEVNIYSGNYDLFSRIVDKNITDINWADLIHIFDLTTLSAALNNTEGYIYPIAETLDGRLSSGASNEIDIRYQVPHVFAKTIWAKIFSEAGLTYYGDFFATNDDFDKKLIPACRAYFDKSLDMVANGIAAAYQNYAAVFQTAPGSPVLADPYNVKLGFAQIDNPNTDLYTHAVQTQIGVTVPPEAGDPTPKNFTTFNLTKTGMYHIKLKGTADVAGNYGTKAELFVYKNGSSFASQVVRDMGSAIDGIDIDESYWDLYVYGYAGDTLHFGIDFTGHEDIGGGVYQSSVQFENIEVNLGFAYDKL